MRFQFVTTLALAALVAGCGPSPAPGSPEPTVSADDQEGRLLQVGQTLSATLTEENPTWGDYGRFQLYRFRARAGERLAIRMGSEEFDTYLVVGDRSGGVFNPIAQDDDSGGDLDARIRFVAPRAGTYWVIAQAYTEYGVGPYTIQLEPLPEPQPLAAIPLAIGSSALGELSEDDAMQEDDDSYYDVYTFEAIEGQRYAIRMSSDAFDTYLHVGTGTSDFEEVQSDDDGGGGTDSRVVFVPERSGTWTIQATSFSGGATGEYSISVGPLAPPGPASYRAIEIGESVTASLDGNDPMSEDGSFYDLYSFRGRSGQRIAVTMRSTDFDSYVELGEQTEEFDAEYSDDDGGGNLDSRLVATLWQDGVYVVRANSLYPDESGTYTLVVEELPAPRPASAQPISLGQTVRGSLDLDDAILDDDSRYDLYTFRGAAGQRIRITLRSEAFDSYLTFGPWQDGRIEVTHSDDDSGGALDSELEVTLAATGQYAIQANSLVGGETGAYTLTLEPR